MGRWMWRAVAKCAVGVVLSAAALFAYTLPGLRRVFNVRERSLNGVITIDDATRRGERAGGKEQAMSANMGTITTRQPPRAGAREVWYILLGVRLLQLWRGMERHTQEVA